MFCYDYFDGTWKSVSSDLFLQYACKDAKNNFVSLLIKKLKTKQKKPISVTKDAEDEG